MRSAFTLLLWVAAASFWSADAHAQNLPFNQPGTTKLFLSHQFARQIAPETSLLPLQNLPNTIDAVFRGSELSAFAPGTALTSLAFRSAGTTFWPATDATFDNYTVSLARGLNAPGLLSSIVADNSAGLIAVHNGPLTIPPSAFAPRPVASAPAPFSFELPFANPYTHNGGHLQLQISHTANSLAGLELDAAPASDDFQSRFAPSAGASQTTNATTTPITRLGVDPRVSLPLVSATTSTGTTTFMHALGTEPATFQFVIAADQLRFIPPGSIITSLALRLAPNHHAWPATDTTSSSFQIQLSASPNPPAMMSENFPSNIVSDAIIVRDGPLTLTPAFFPATISGPALFGSPIHFTRGYVYNGGDLCVVVRHEPFTSSAPALDTSTQPAAARTIFVQDTSSADGSFTPDASLSLQLGYTPSICTISSLATKSGGSGAWLFDSPRVHQLLIASSELDNIPRGSTLNGISFRVSSVENANNNFASWPATDGTTPQFDIDISTTTVQPPNMFNTFAANEGPDKLRVRSGSLNIPAQSFKVVGASVAEHSFFVHFTTPFIYNGGNLCVTMRLGQFTGITVNMDGVFRPAGHNARRSIGSSAATFGNTALSFAARLAYTPPPNNCPADLNADGFVDDADFSLFITAYDVFETPAADFNFDAATDDADFSIFIVAYDNFLCP